MVINCTCSLILVQHSLMWRCSHRHLLEPQLCLSFCWLHQTVLVLKILWPNSPNSFSATSMTASGLLPVQNWSTLLLTSIIPSNLLGLPQTNLFPFSINLSPTQETDNGLMSTTNPLTPSYRDHTCREHVDWLHHGLVWQLAHCPLPHLSVS